jgi:hypothetical protein
MFHFHLNRNDLAAWKQNLNSGDIPSLGFDVPFSKQPWPHPSMAARAQGDLSEVEQSGLRGHRPLLLIDREGILRADVSPQDLGAEIEKLINTK